MPKRTPGGAKRKGTRGATRKRRVAGSAARERRAEGRRIARRAHAGERPGELRRRAAAVKAKKARGATLTRREAGVVGAAASVRSTRRERERAERAGRGREFEREHRVKTWTTDPGEAREPTVPASTRARVEEVRAKQERGAKLTREEAGVLGGAARAREGSED